jgi:hypothetical protein
LRPAVAQPSELKDLGIDTIMDLTVLGLGRYVPRIEKGTAAARSTGAPVRVDDPEHAEIGSPTSRTGCLTRPTTASHSRR